MSTDERDWRYGSSSGSEHTDVSTSNGHGDDDHEELLREREVRKVAPLMDGTDLSSDRRT